MNICCCKHKNCLLASTRSVARISSRLPQKRKNFIFGKFRERNLLCLSSVVVFFDLLLAARLIRTPRSKLVLTQRTFSRGWRSARVSLSLDCLPFIPSIQVLTVFFRRARTSLFFSHQLKNIIVHSTSRVLWRRLSSTFEGVSRQ